MSNIEVQTVKEPRASDGRHRFTFHVSIDPRYVASLGPGNPHDLGQALVDALIESLHIAVRGR